MTQDRWMLNVYILLLPHLLLLDVQNIKQGSSPWDGNVDKITR